MLLRELAVVAAMLAVAYFNRFIAMPRLRATFSKGMRPMASLFAMVPPLTLCSAPLSLARRPFSESPCHRSMHNRGG